MLDSVMIYVLAGYIDDSDDDHSDGDTNNATVPGAAATKSVNVNNGGNHDDILYPLFHL